jgi:tRNA nucleotidyltransferase (CCA-adding enzyme)
VRFACLCHDLGKGTTRVEELPRHFGHEARSVELLRDLCTRLRVPVECRELAEVVAREHGNIHRSGELNAAALMRLLERCDALRRPDRFKDALFACECDARGRLGLGESPYPQRACLTAALTRALAADAAAVVADAQARGVKGPGLADAVRAARVQAIAEGLGPTTRG